MQYGNDINVNDAHSNEYAASAVSDQSFAERQDIERHRERVAAYRDSSIARSHAPRGQYSRATLKRYKSPERKMSRQEMNANRGITPEHSATQNQSTTRQKQQFGTRSNFQEPASRGYNPYG